MRANKAMFYVYELIDPRYGVVFYVGKGSGKRIDQHEKDAKRGERSRKCDLIREIEAQGKKIKKQQVVMFFDEQDAYDYETELINSYGLETLTNVIAGGQTAWIDRVALMEKKKLIAKHTDKRLIRFIALSLRARSGEHRVFHGLNWSQALWGGLKKRNPFPLIEKTINAIGLDELNKALQLYGVRVV